MSSVLMMCEATPVTAEVLPPVCDVGGRWSVKLYPPVLMACEATPVIDMSEVWRQALLHFRNSRRAAGSTGLLDWSRVQWNGTEEESAELCLCSMNETEWIYLLETKYSQNVCQLAKKVLGSFV